MFSLSLATNTFIRITKWLRKPPILDSAEKYTRLACEESACNDPSSLPETLQFSDREIAPRNPWLFGKAAWTLTLAVVLTATFSISITSYVIRHPNTTDMSFSMTPSEVMVAPCGSTPAEARARGCHFDVVSFCWLPDSCYDSDLSDAFDGYTKWEWFLDPNKTQPISHETAMTGEHTDLFVNWEYHLRHCTAMWKKLHRAVLGKGKAAIDGYIGPLAHTEHCSNMLLQERDVSLKEINTIIRVKFPDCGIA